MTENTEQGFTIKAVVDASEAVAEQSYQNAVDAGAKVAELETRLEEATHARDVWFDRFMKVKNFMQASLDREEWTCEELSEPFWEELAELLNLDLRLEREITVTATWNLTVKGKADLSAYDFNVSIESDNGQLDILSGESWPDVDISE